jgi:hypothetical protein
MTDRYADWDAAYVLGALGPAERREYAAHLEGCESCRRSVSDLAALPGLLASVPADTFPVAAPARERAPEAGPDGGSLDGVLPGPVPGGEIVPLARVAAAARRSRVRRRVSLAAAAAAVAVGGVFAGSALGPNEMAGPPTAAPTSDVVAQAVTVRLTPVGDEPMWADLVATPKPWGTRLEWSCRYDRQATTAAPDGGGYGSEPVTYELVLVDRQGTRVVAATWTTPGSDATGLGASSALPIAALERIEIAVAGQPQPLAAATL